MPLSIDSTWGRLSPNLRRGLVITGVLGGIAAILVLAFGQPEPRAVREQRAREQLTRTLLTDVDPRALGIDGLARRLERLEQQLAAATGAIARQDARETHAVDREVAALREVQETQLQDLQRQIAALKAEVAVSRAASSTKPQRPERTETATESPPSSPPALDDPALFAPATDGTGGLKALTPNRTTSRLRTSPLTIRVVAQEPQARMRPPRLPRRRRLIPPLSRS